MKTALLISSCVAASHVGASASTFCLQRLGHRVITVPTTMLGRHPGWGPPGGQALSATHLASIWSAIKAQNIAIDAVMTGYMGDEDHVGLTAEIITDVKAANPEAFILVDPVMGDMGAGDRGQLYIPEKRAQAIKQTLVPLADIISPNIWELSYLTQQETKTIDKVRKAARALPCDALVTSVMHKDKIGALLASKKQACAVYHDKFDTVPHGGGDALAATFIAHILSGKSQTEALAQSTASIFEILAITAASGELALIKGQEALINARPLTLETL